MSKSSGPADVIPLVKEAGADAVGESAHENILSEDVVKLSFPQTEVADYPHG